ncbi:MAG: S8 family serine peptidase [Thiobacillus sp.]
MHQLPRTLIAVLLTFSTVNLAFAAPPVRGGQAEDRLRHHVDRLTRDPARIHERITLILEADALQQADISPHEGLIRYRRGRLHEVSIPANKVAALLNALPSTVLARLPYPHQAVAVTGQGVAITGAADMQAQGNNAAGIKVGVIDLGFGSLSTAQASGDLPPTGSNLTVTDYTGTGTGGTSHGTNVAEIVHEMAPGASLYLAKISTEVQLNQALTDMAAAGVKVINHSVAWFAAAFYDGTGPICDIANSADTQGVQWINAMGNSRLKHYLGTFTDSNADLRHEFAAGQNYNTINLTSGSAVSLILNWSAYPTTTIDYDLYLYNGNPDSGGVLVAASLNRQSGKGPSYYPYPYEAIDYTPATSGTFYIVVKKATAAQANRALTLFSTGPDLITRTTASSILQPADCAKVMGVGAVNLSDNAESFSSEGPTTDGRAKPEIAAPDGVKTSLSSAFYGTSAASPHATGAAALVLAANPGMTPAQLRAALPAAVQDVGSAGFDYRTGSGRISLDADGDGLNHDAERLYGTSPVLADTDGDGLTDGQEVQLYGTSPTLADSDGDGLSDGQEVLVYSTDPSLSNIGDLAPRNQPDGVVNVADLLILTRLIEQLDAPSSEESALGDINGDGVLDVRDILRLQQQLGN